MPAVQIRPVGLRHGFAHQSLQLRQGRFLVGPRVDAITEHGLPPAVPQEVAQHGFVIERIEEHLLVIADEQLDGAFGVPLHRKLYYAGTVRAAIDEIAQQHRCAARCAAASLVVLDRLDQCGEQVAAPVDIANCVEPLTRRHSGANRRGPGAEDLAQGSEHADVRAAVDNSGIVGAHRRAAIMRQSMSAR